MIAIDRDLDPGLLCSRPYDRPRRNRYGYIINGQVDKPICFLFCHNFITMYVEYWAPGVVAHTINQSIPKPISANG